MSLFGGILDAIGLGGNETTVTQQAANSTQVDVTVQNTLDTGPLAQALQQLGLMQQASADKQAEATTKGATSLAKALEGIVKAELEQSADTTAKVLPWVRLVGFAAAAYLLMKAWKMWR